MKYIAFLLLFAPNASFSQTHEHGLGSPSSISHTIDVDGIMPKPVKLTLTDIKKLPAVTKANVKISGTGGMVKHTFQTIKGVLLKDLLLKAGIDNSNFKEAGKLYIVATATDGYKAVFSWSEIFNSASSLAIMVIYEENGKPVKDDGEFILLSINDTVNGIRHVKWLSEITVKQG